MTLPHRLLLLAATPLWLGVDGREVAARDGANVERPVWSADGKQLSYEANFHDEKVIELYVGDPDAKQFKRVLPSLRSSAVTAGFSSKSAAGKVVHEITFSPPLLSRFAYTASTDEQDYDLFIQGGGAIGSVARFADGGASWSPDGQYLAFTSARTGDGDLYLLDVTVIEVPPRRITSDPTSSELDATWSPDGKRLAYVGHSKVGDNIWLLPDLKGTPVALTSWSGVQTRPAFSPDGKRVAFYADHDVPERFDLWVVDATAGATPVKLAESVVPNATGPCFTPDGANVIYVANDDEHFDPLAWVAIAAPGAPHPLAFGTVGHGDLDVAKRADGKTWLAYVAQGRANDANRDFKRLFVAPLDLP